MKKVFSTVLILCMLIAVVPVAEAFPVSIDNMPLSGSVLINSTTYVPLRATAVMLDPSAQVSWENHQAYVRTSNLTLIARPGNQYIDANGRMIFARDGVKLVNNTTLVPIRVLAKAMGATVNWNPATSLVTVTRGSGTITSGDLFYDADAVYWLSRIINAESKGEPLLGQIAVGNVVLNRVNSPDFPNNIYDVIFDRNWGVQFQPTANGTIYNSPTANSVLAAKLCLDGASVVGNCLYFLNVNTAVSFWIVNNRSYFTTIGNHKFYA